jgi:hypothetical protein
MIGRYFENIFNQEFIMKSAAQINLIENKLPSLIVKKTFKFSKHMKKKVLRSIKESKMT